MATHVVLYHHIIKTLYAYSDRYKGMISYADVVYNSQLKLHVLNCILYPTEAIHKNKVPYSAKRWQWKTLVNLAN